ncbi:MAG: AAA-like domain-containing protein [Pelatocladus maniniholoensis HA4357-MV3]|jgi:ABC-type branched-subunit amino acid transport system substrate-binding protein|uniref:AAA-like domain-containing protein n=1 Tax=Pelatocladus maniniholoensis HA4357-MV3 TaxID=1117104 RepID=A0A9E3LSB8_9NOST|nr:AAA-like domain-containing protein [Pelatocladus maniniholoensis HA4357-MV3]BAZ65383.1 TPR repeat-containing protein [Fischerella sp. NIES-4106]
MNIQPSFIYQVGSSLPVDAPTYVRRKADQELYHALKVRKFCYILNSRQMGKSSLKVQTMHRLQQEGIVCAAIDTTLILEEGVTAQKWYKGLIRRLVSSFKISEDFNWRIWWQEREQFSCVQCWIEFIEDVLLKKIFGNIVIFIDEIDRLLSLNFKDDFFAVIRALDNLRTEKPEYRRLTFALLGVATPSDLISDKNRTPFNIGQAIELTGFELAETVPLVAGLQNHVENPQAVLKEVLYWTGGQPFLTQKLCKLIVDCQSPIPVGHEVECVEKIVQSQIISNWEGNDEPQHLRTIRDRILCNEQPVVQLLCLYQQILQQDEIKADKSQEQLKLRLSGLVVKCEGKLRIYNRIYKAIFDKSWVNQILAQQRPYAIKLNAWLDSNCQDKSKLLRGKALQYAWQWAKDKSLSDRDYQFLNASQELQRRSQQRFALGLVATLMFVVGTVVGLRKEITDLIFDYYSSSLQLAEPERFSEGERNLFGDFSQNYNRILGIEAFEQKNYAKSIELFQKALKANPDDPVVKIYYNNARANQQGNPLTLAVVTSGYTRKITSLELLRGVAQAQENFNKKRNKSNARLLKIIIANDDTEPIQAAKIARRLVINSNVMGVIGHQNSTASMSALPIYEKAGLAMISPSSASDLLKGKFFHRTTATAQKFAEKMTEYLIYKKLKRVNIFYNPDDTYGKNIASNLEKLLFNHGISIIRKVNLNNPMLNPEAEVLRSQQESADALMLFPDINFTSVAIEIYRASNNLTNQPKKMLILGAGSFNYPDILAENVFIKDLILVVPSINKSYKESEKKCKQPVTWLTGTSYNATQAFIQALSSSKQPSRSTVLAKINSMSLEVKEPVIVKVVKNNGNCQESQLHLEAVIF